MVFTESEEFLYNGKVFIENREVCGCGMVSRFLYIECRGFHTFSVFRAFIV